MKKFTVLTNNDLERARTTSINRKSVRIEHKGTKLYVPVLPLPSGSKPGHVGWRTRALAEQVFDTTASINKTRILRVAGML
jgi:hypothetical protein